MRVTSQEDVPLSLAGIKAQSPAMNHPFLRGVGVVREGRQERFLEAPPALSSSAVHWRGIALENWSVPAVLIAHHQHPDHFLHVVLRGAVKYQVATRGRVLRFTSRPGTIFLLPRGTVDEVNWLGPTHRVALAIHPRLLTGALEETAHQADVELQEHWDLVDSHISALVSEDDERSWQQLTRGNHLWRITRQRFGRVSREVLLRAAHHTCFLQGRIVPVSSQARA